MFIEALLDRFGQPDFHFSYFQITYSIAFLLPACYLALYTYRLTFHPLSKYPGPRLAAATYWYEYYYDVTKQGSFIWQILALHKKYGL